MRFRSATFWLFVWLSTSLWLQAGSARILKVLPHYLDLEGRHALAPSLYERDAYQAYLRKHPDERSALRFDINWKAKSSEAPSPILRIELRNDKTDAARPVILEAPVKSPKLFSRWSSLLLRGEQYAQFGQLLAWRVTLWQGDQLLAEQRSFLW